MGRRGSCVWTRPCLCRPTNKLFWECMGQVGLQSLNTFHPQTPSPRHPLKETTPQKTVSSYLHTSGNNNQKNVGGAGTTRSLQGNIGEF